MVHQQSVAANNHFSVLLQPTVAAPPPGYPAPPQGFGPPPPNFTAPPQGQPGPPQQFDYGHGES